MCGAFLSFAESFEAFEASQMEVERFQIRDNASNVTTLTLLVESIPFWLLIIENFNS